MDRNIVPRPYQELAIKAALKGLRDQSRRALVVMATGLGKTFTSAFIAKEFQAKRILFLVHNNFILDHALSEFRLVFDETTFPMAIYNGRTKKRADTACLVFSTWQTMGKHLSDWERDHFDLVIVDEAHHTSADTYVPVTEYFTGAKLGITATPDRTDDSDIRDIFGPEVIAITLEEAIARGWLPKIEYHVITDESLDENVLQKIVAEIRESKRRFTMAEVNRRLFIKKREEEIAKIIDSYGQKAIVFCRSIPYTERIVHFLDRSVTFHSKKGISAHDTWRRNTASLEALDRGEIRSICAVDALNEGVNMPSVGLVAFCRVTESIIIFRQQTGRGLRPGKDKLIVLDFVGNLERIRLVLQFMNRIADEREKHKPKEHGDHDQDKKEDFVVSGENFEFVFSDRIEELFEVMEHCEKEFYETWQEASKAAIALECRSKRHYKSVYLQDNSLPHDPSHFYDAFPGWKVFLKKPSFYETWEEAGQATIALGCFSSEKYMAVYKGDKRLPSAPDQYYSDFPGWKRFLGKKEKKFYKTWKEAGKAAITLRCTSKEHYQRKICKLDNKLPTDPARYYSDFPGWRRFLGKKEKKFYKTWKEASKAVIALGCLVQPQYRVLYKKDEKLTSCPDVYYQDFPGWKKFLGKE